MQILKKDRSEIYWVIKIMVAKYGFFPFWTPPLPRNLHFIIVITDAFLTPIFFFLKSGPHVDLRSLFFTIWI